MNFKRYLTEFLSKIALLLMLIYGFSASGALCAKTPSYKYDLVLCAIFQNEADYLREWIEFHKLVGIKHFYLYNNNSSDNYQEALHPYIQSGEVELIQWRYKPTAIMGWSEIQCKAYNHAIKMAKKQAKWLAIIDTDEFLFPVKTDNLAQFLLDYEDVAALCVNWQMYGTSHVKQIFPGHLLIEDLIYKAETHHGGNVHVKSIVRPQFVKKVDNPHYVLFLPGHFQVNSDKERFSGAFSPVKVDKVRINHYWTRDEHFFYQVKIPRRQGWQDGGALEAAGNLNKEIDTAIFKYVPKLKKALVIP